MNFQVILALKPMSHEKRKLPRFHISPCQFHSDTRSRNYPVQDISLGGLAIRLSEKDDLAHFTVASQQPGTVKVEGRKLTCRFEVKYIRGTLVGGEWVEPSPELLSHLEAISHPVKLGESLRKYELPDFAGTDWYHNPVGVDLLLYFSEAGESPRTLNRWTLYVHHSFVQWESEDGIRTGQAVAEDDGGYAHGIVRLETRLIDYHPVLDRTLIDTARELVKTAPIADGSHRERILSHLEKGVLT